jgi:hypothetical protein
MELRLCPVCGFEVENDDISEVLAVLVLSTKDKKFTALPETGGVAWIVVLVEPGVLHDNKGQHTHPYPWDVAVVVHEVPLPRYQV